MRQAFVLVSVLLLSSAPAVLAHNDHFGFRVTYAHPDAPSVTSCTLHIAPGMTGHSILRAAINQTCIGQFGTRDGRLACIDDVCEMRGTQWIAYLNETRICRDPCNILFVTFQPEQRLEFVYTNEDAVDLLALVQDQVPPVPELPDTPEPPETPEVPDAPDVPETPT